MRAPLLLGALLAASAWTAAPAGAQQGGTPQVSPSLGSQGAGAAAAGGVQGDCPAGQVRSASGQCAPGQPDPTGATTGPAGGADMPASPHQQELLKGQQGSESTPK
jgi:hypothetical protein